MKLYFYWKKKTLRVDVFNTTQHSLFVYSKTFLNDTFMNALTPWFSSRHEKSEDPPVVLLVTQQSSNKLKEKKKFCPRYILSFPGRI